MFAKSVEDAKALRTANKTIMILLLNIKHTMKGKKKKKIPFMENSSCLKDKGLPAKEGRTSSNLYPRIVSQGSGFSLGLCY